MLSYNVHGLRDDRAALVAVVRALAPDVAILQEAPRRLGWRVRRAHLAHDFGLVVAAGGLPALGNLLLTSPRVRVRDTWCLRYPLTPGRHLRGMVFAQCALGPVSFLVAGSHLSTDPAERGAQAGVLRQQLSRPDLPVVLGADVNEQAPGAAWRTVAEGLVDVAAATGHADLSTFSCAHPRQRLDALFVDPRVRITRYEVVDTPGARRASDHFPVVADLVLPT